MLNRKDVPMNLKWKTEDMFENLAEWNALFAKTEKRIDFAKYEGKLNTVETVKACFDELYSVMGDLELLGVYAYMKHDEDSRDSESSALLARIDELEVRFSSAIAFMTPELTALDISVLESFVNDPRLKDYDYEIKGIIKDKAHVLGKEAEGVLAMGGQVFSSFRNIFGMINNADLPFPEITVRGKKIKVSHGTYGVLMQDSDRAVRRKTFKAYYGAFIGLINTIAATYIANVNKNVYISRVRKYESCLDRALSSEDVYPEVYNNLIESVSAGMKTMHEYVAVRKKELGYKELHMYDVYTPLVEGANLELDYEDAFKLVKEGLKPLGEEYGKLLQRAHDERWIDVEETDGKRSGAYSISVYKCAHPYVLLNYQKTTNDIFTIAHELGHAMHSYYSNTNQNVINANYTIMVAEVASTVNEIILGQYLIGKEKDKGKRAALINTELDKLRATLIRQTMFAEFEKIVHEKVENDEQLTSDKLCDIYLELNKKYFGEDVIVDEEIKYEWARIPHFYSCFYVYKYATGISAAIAIAKKILSGEKGFVEKYINMLKQGCTKKSVDLLKMVDVDLESKKPYEDAFEFYKQNLDELNKIV